jgi:hypothetical protein
MSWYDDNIGIYDIEGIIDDIEEYFHDCKSNNVRLPNPEKGWVDQYGKLWKYSDMKASHLLNCYKKIIRESWRLNYLPYIEKELLKRCS